MAVSRLSPKELTKEALIIMLHIGLDLSRKRLDFDLLCEDGSRIERGAAPPDAERATQYGDIDEARAAAERLAESRG